jgi:hypothetical protein
MESTHLSTIWFKTFKIFNLKKKFALKIKLPYKYDKNVKKHI